MKVLLWKIFILNDNFIIFHDIVGGYTAEVLWCTWTLFCVLADGIANFIIYLFWLLLYCDWCYCYWSRCFEAHFILFSYYCIVTDVIVTASDVLRPIFYIVIMVHDVIEPFRCQGGHQGPGVVGLLLELPLFLFSGGSLTVISIASLMDLASQCRWSTDINVAEWTVKKKIYWGIRQNICKKVQRTYECPLIYPWWPQHH